MDPWVHTQIRLAERQGLLVGRELGPVQVKAVFLCEMLELVTANKLHDQQFRQTLYATGRFEYADLFPERTPSEESAQAIDADLDSEEQVRYIFPQPGTPGAIGPEEAERLLRELVGESSSGTVSAAEIGVLDWGGP
jgi:hypothetical protein